MRSLFQEAVEITREHAEKQKRLIYGEACWQNGRNTLADALLSELEVMRDLPYREDVVEERRALLAHLREWLEGR